MCFDQFLNSVTSSQEVFQIDFKTMKYLTTSLVVPPKFLGANYSGSLLATVAGSYRLIIMQSSKLVLKIPILIEVIPAPEYSVHYSRLIMFSQSVIIGKTFAAHVLFSDSFGNLKPVDLSVLELQIDGEN